ncbi:hypothetical protein [Nocardiopsis suaedae]|uniref:Uncharacterized protein n=1 Tax=Nocardiopsis suaedae TaxID=3018444 RepID=A0ABT4TM23_9ACTN|nr:hypothetical protein [Nocardiopsis suaedae]MDA2805750.1 hypothetical protein [Nocardiopsis suaedae]
MSIARNAGAAALIGGLAGAMLLPFPAAAADDDPHEVEYVYLENRIEAYDGDELVGFVEVDGKERLHVEDERCDDYSPHAEVDAEPGTEYWDDEGCFGDGEWHEAPRSYHFRLSIVGQNHSEWHPIT